MMLATIYWGLEWGLRFCISRKSQVARSHSRSRNDNACIVHWYPPSGELAHEGYCSLWKLPECQRQWPRPPFLLYCRSLWWKVCSPSCSSIPPSWVFFLPIMVVCGDDTLATGLTPSGCHKEKHRGLYNPNVSCLDVSIKCYGKWGKDGGTASIFKNAQA